MKILAPISVGELLDKLTILIIKMEKIKDSDKLKNILYEHSELKQLADSLKAPIELANLYKNLLEVNRDLWEIEEAKRKHEKEQNFDSEFIKLARAVYIKNDYRAQLKKEINLIMGSSIVEEKSY